MSRLPSFMLGISAPDKALQRHRSSRATWSAAQILGAQLALECLSKPVQKQAGLTQGVQGSTCGLEQPAKGCSAHLGGL